MTAPKVFKRMYRSSVGDQFSISPPLRHQAAAVDLPPAGDSGRDRRLGLKSSMFIGLELEERAGRVEADIKVRPHRTELMHPEDPTVLGDPSPVEEHRPGVSSRMAAARTPTGKAHNRAGTAIARSDTPDRFTGRSATAIAGPMMRSPPTGCWS